MDGEDLPTYGETSHTTSVTPETLAGASTSANTIPSLPPPAFSKYAPPPGPPPVGPPAQRGTLTHGRSRSSASHSSSGIISPPFDGQGPGQGQGQGQHRRSHSSTGMPVASHSYVPPSTSASSGSSSLLHLDQANSRDDQQKELPPAPTTGPSTPAPITISGLEDYSEGRSDVHVHGDSSPSSSAPVSPNAIPSHWGSKNPFATMMGER
ncbi:hypothetical protein BT96DRAFT_117716 [Gymnopus androsaceus JB14]|uniref:Uncharacterized protein n=1 Tax=Gymnopus androsaceus JB14 TaxID=1447944 RepID=A0A6A4HH04_9AGAR|nr:hypothetical protein BT96DRAFT_117716 [Gymnopus androsaceus JB14]